jgi:hypothetical protein
MKSKLIWRIHQAAVLLCLCLPMPVMGQDCSITGRVLDAGQAAVATAVVTVTQVDSGSRRQVLSNAQGFFRIAALPPGKYRIDAEKPGFHRPPGTFVGLDQGSTATVDLQMEEAEVSETVTLEARRARAGSLLAYICGLSPGSGCETIELEPTLSAQSDLPLLP